MDALTVKYEPIVYYQKKLFREKIVAGYRIQIYYDGIPFGELSERIVYQSNEVDKEATVRRSTMVSHPKQNLRTIGKFLSSNSSIYKSSDSIRTAQNFSSGCLDTGSKAELVT